MTKFIFPLCKYVPYLRPAVEFFTCHWRDAIQQAVRFSLTESKYLNIRRGLCRCAVNLKLSLLWSLGSSLIKINFALLDWLVIKSIFSARDMGLALRVQAGK